jgi:AraC-like DNA-binding protein
VAYVTRKPAAPLSTFIDSLWWLSDAPSHREERIVPSGTQELVINLAENAFTIRAAASPNRVQLFSGAMASGAYRTYFVIDTRAHACLLGAHFKPGGAGPFLGVPPGGLADRHVDLDALWGTSAQRLRERLCEATTLDTRFQLFEAALLERLRRPFRGHPAVQLAVRRLSEGANGVGQLAAELGLSRRRLIEVFSAEVGMTPKTFARVQRFQRALSAARDRLPQFSELSWRAGYCDQSHLIRDFVAFSGFSPLKLLGSASPELKDNHAIHRAG